MLALDYEALASDFLRALRGKRSQRAFARRLGYRTNIAYTWESGRSFPSASRALSVAARVGIDVRAALGRFFGTPPPWLESVDPTSPDAVVQLLVALRGRQPILDVSRTAHRSRFAVARWLSGAAEPRLPDLFRLIEAMSRRLLDFVATMTDPAALPSAAEAWSRLEATRRAAYELPWSHVVLRGLELRDYEELPRHAPGWIASRTGVSEAEEQECLELLVRTGQVEKRRGKYRVVDRQTVDTRRDAEAAQRLRAWWGNVAVERATAGAAGVTSYSLFTVSQEDFERLCDLQRAFFQQVRSIVAESQPCERVVLACAQMVDLEPGRQDG